MIKKIIAIKKKLIAEAKWSSNPFVEIPKEEIPKGTEMNRQEVLDSWESRVNLDPDGNPEDCSMPYKGFSMRAKLKSLLFL